MKLKSSCVTSQCPLYIQRSGLATPSGDSALDALPPHPFLHAARKIFAVCCRRWSRSLCPRLMFCAVASSFSRLVQLYLIGLRRLITRLNETALFPRIDCSLWRRRRSMGGRIPRDAKQDNLTGAYCCLNPICSPEATNDHSEQAWPKICLFASVIGSERCASGAAGLRPSWLSEWGLIEVFWRTLSAGSETCQF